MLLRSVCQADPPVSGRLPIIVGITGPQGCGKTTLCASLLAGLGALGIKAAASSMDDFYLPTKFLSPVVFLGENCSGQKLLPRRGPPGTHDINLCRSVLESIKQRKPNIMLPKYDKSQMNGRGDRSNEAVLLDATDIDVFLLEGWMLGFRHVDPKVLTGWNFSEPQRAELHQVNESLKDYEPLYAYIDLWLVVKVETPQWVYKWRRQQEEDTRKQTGSGMTAGEVDGFVDRFMPLYTVYLPGLYANPPLSGGDPRDRRCLLVEVTEQRIVKYAAFI